MKGENDRQSVFPMELTAEMVAGFRLIGAGSTLPRKGEVRVTPAFGITNAKFVIHAVGPLYVDGRHGEPEKLAACYRNLLAAAVANGCVSVAVPSISTGIFGYPLQEAATIAVRETKAFLATHPGLEVVFVAWNDETKELYERLLSK